MIVGALVFVIQLRLLLCGLRPRQKINQRPPATTMSTTIPAASGTNIERRFGTASVKVFLSLGIGSFSVVSAAAQCQSSATPSCAVYKTCFEATCKCETSPYPYFISYGKKYCERFLASNNWSEAGKMWRDRTLVCLQEKIVAILPDSVALCDCKALKSAAFKIHVACYTQTGASVCDLGLGDWATIYGIIDKHDLFTDPEGRVQMLAVAQICVESQHDGPIKDILNKIINILQ
jgi:hypothetical protein